MTDDRPTILFVDDEPNILRALRRLFMDDDWNLLFANSGVEGLEILARETVDVAVSDFRMPEMDGMQFLTQVKQLHPSIVRIFLSGYAEKQSVAQALAEGCAQQIIAKPWDEQELRQILEKTLRQCRAQKEKGTDLQSLLNNIPSLPTLPTTYLELRECLADRENADLEKVATIVDRDVAMATTLLRWANSALFSQRSRIETVKRAIVVLGTDIVEGLLLSKTLQDTLGTRHIPGFDFNAFQAHSTGCAMLTRMLAQRRHPGETEVADRAFTAAMLHDLGKLVEAEFFSDQFARAVAATDRENGLLIDCEKAESGFSHAEIGGWLASWWNLPLFIVQSVRWHHEPGECNSERPIVSLVHVANSLVQEFGIGCSGNSRPPEVDPRRWEQFDLTPEFLQEMQERVREFGSLVSS